jgi:UDP-glucuronate 4-epimerase
MHFLVTGGAGFIGSHVVDRLLAVHGGSITVFDDFNDFYTPAVKRENTAGFGTDVEVVEGDIRDRGAIDRLFADRKFDVVVHLAARAGVRPSIDHPELYISTNINGTYNLLDAAQRSGVGRFVFASSSSVYGVNKKVPFAESDPINRTISIYAATKLAGEQLCSNFEHLHGMRTICLRFFTVYGPRQRPDLAISKFCKLIDSDRPIDRYGDGSTGRDYTYIDDIVQGVMGAIEYDGASFDIFNLGGSQTVTLSQLIQEIEAAMGKKATINELPEQPGDVPLTSADISKAELHLGYRPHTSISEGVQKYVKWYRSQK